MIRQFRFWKAIFLIPIIGICGCYISNDNEGPENPPYSQPTYTAQLNTTVEIDSTSSIMLSTAIVQGYPYGSYDSGWSVTLNSVPLKYSAGSNSYSSDSIVLNSSRTLNWSVSEGTRANLRELAVSSRSPSIPNKIIFPNDTTIVSIDSPIFVEWVPDSTHEPVNVEVIDSAGNTAYEWTLPNNGSDTIHPQHHRQSLIAGPAMLRIFRDNIFNGYSYEFNYQVVAEARNTAHFTLK